MKAWQPDDCQVVAKQTSLGWSWGSGGLRSGSVEAGMSHLLGEGHAAQISQGSSKAAIGRDDDVHIIGHQGQGLCRSQHLHTPQGVS